MIKLFWVESLVALLILGCRLDWFVFFGEKFGKIVINYFHLSLVASPTCAMFLESFLTWPGCGDLVLQTVVFGNTSI